MVADCITESPGGPIHVLVSDEVAEHIPGCNMAIRRDALTEIGGFDPRFRTAGDDVDICWRLQDAGHRIGFNASAVVWHHRRCHVSSYFKQQYGYGKAEGLLERKWPDRYNRAGHLRWAGRVYGRGASRARASRRAKINYGRWGGRLFQTALDWLERDGPRTIWIGVWSENLGAQRFYARHGFAKAGEYEFPVGRVRDREFILRRTARA